MRLSWLCGFLTVFVAWCISRWLTQESQEAVPTVWVAVLSRPSAASHRRLTHTRHVEFHELWLCKVCSVSTRPEIGCDEPSALPVP